MTKNDLYKLDLNSYIKIDGKLYKYNSTRSIHSSTHFVFLDDNKRELVITFSNDYFHCICFDNHLTTYSIDFVIKLSEKEHLEIQLKDAEELVQKETARVDSIKAKIEELSKPKLKIGGLYSFLIGQTKYVGVLTRIDKYYYYIITSELNRYTFTYGSCPFESANFREITNHMYSHIGPTILEFMKLNPENFQ